MQSYALSKILNNRFIHLDPNFANEATIKEIGIPDIN